MLTHLSIRNIVLAKQVSFDLAEGLCVLTGETGAGKSILLDALGLALGARADARLVRAGEKEASVSACFDVSDVPAAQAALEEFGMEPAQELVIRRQLSVDGKSKCFVNDQPVSVGALKRIGETLIEVHGQHDQRGLMEVGLQLELLDAYGKLMPLRAKVAKAYEAWRSTQAELAELETKLANARREQEYLEHVAEELSALNVQAGEAGTLADQRTLMMQGEKLAGTLNEALSGLDGERSAQMMLGDVQRLLLRTQPKEGLSFEVAIDALERAQQEVQSAEDTLRDLLEKSAYNPQELEHIEERLFAIRAAARKHNCMADELPALYEKAKASLSSLANDESERAELMEQISVAKAAYMELAESLSAKRAKTGRALEKALTGELEPLKMGACRFQVAQDRLQDAQAGARGIDAIRFEAATNKGQPFAALHAIASGGELSRFMLALKVVLSSVKSTPTMIFDEIDTGTGGAVADAIGARLAALASEAQVLCVTHLPQVAARGNQHLLIEKSEHDGTTQTQITVLDDKARKEELARMLAGASVTKEARSAAEKLLEAAG